MSRSHLTALVLAAAVSVSLTLTPGPAYADDGAGCSKWGSCQAVAKQPAKPAKSHKHSSKPSSGHRATAKPGKNSAAERAAAIQRQFQREVAAYKAALAKQRACMATLHPIAGKTSDLCGSALTRPNQPRGPLRLVGARGRAAPVVPTVTPEQAAYMAVAQLQLPASAPGIGPDPAKNEWHMAVVGYPLWLWADGPAHVGPVSQSVANLSVSLDARISKTVFRMGDGRQVTCPGGGKPYASWVQPGAKSPTCGYSYTKPSLPVGKYTVTAITYWAVTWTVNGTSGVIDVPRQSAALLPVGELQAVIVR